MRRHSHYIIADHLNPPRLWENKGDSHYFMKTNLIPLFGTVSCGIAPVMDDGKLGGKCSLTAQGGPEPWGCLVATTSLKS